MEIVLVPPIIYHEEIYTIGVRILEKILKSEGYSVKVVSLSVNKETFFKEKNQYQAWANLLLAEKPDLIGFSTIGNSFPLILLIAKEIKLLSPETTVILGGIQASLTAEDVLNNFPYIDYILAGESEKTFSIFLKALESGEKFSPNTILILFGEKQFGILLSIFTLIATVLGMLFQFFGIKTQG